MADGSLPITDKPKHPGGRPPTYRPEFCDRIIELGRLGYSQARMAADIGVSKQTITDWAKQHGEFSDALTHARTLSQAHWEEKGYNSLDNKNFNVPLYLGSMKSMFRDDYMDRSVNEVVGKDGGPLEVTDSSTDARAIAFMLGRAIGRQEKAAEKESHST